MSSPKRSGFSGRIDAMAEDIRRLKLRTGSSAAAVGAWLDLEPYLGNGWSTNAVGTYGHFRAYVDRERVYFEGLLQYFAGAGTDNQHPLATPLPAALRPSVLVSIPVFSEIVSGAPTQEWWVVYFLHTGTMEFTQNSPTPVAPDFAAPPDGTRVTFSHVSYRVT